MGPTVAQKLGPLGLNIGKLISDINTATSKFKGIKVPVSLDIDSKTKQVKIEVSTPPTSGLLKKDLGIEKGTAMSKKVKVGNASMEQIISVAKTKEDGMLVNNFKKAVKSVVGSCVSLGILIESKEAKDVSKEIDSGIYDNLINKQVTKASPEKLKKLAEEFDVIKKKQEELLKAEEEAKAAAEAAAAAAVPAAAEGEKKEEAKTVAPVAAEAAPAKEAKKEEPKKK